MVAIPADTPVITPVVETVANCVLEEVQVPPASPLEVKVVVPLLHIACVPLNVPALGAVVTVTVLVAVVFEQPPVPVTVYVIIAVPPDTPDTSPVEKTTVAMAVFDEVHAPPVFPFEVYVVDPVLHMAWVPLTVPALGAVVTVTVLVAVEVAQPPVPRTV